MAAHQTITERELRAAYKRSGLWRLGVTYERAIDVPAIRTALNCSIKAARRRAEQAGRRIPAQLGLI